MLETLELQVFASVAKHLSFSLAAAEIGHSSPHASKVIAQLEEKLGKKLFLRTTRSVRLTREGEQLLPMALKALDSLQEAQDLFQTTGNLTGKIRATAPQTLLHRVFGKQIADFHSLHPEVELEFIFSDFYLDLVEEDIDVAFRIMKLHNSSLMSRKIGNNSVVFCASPDYLKSAPKLSNISDLKNHPLLVINQYLDLKFQKSGKKLGHLIKPGWIKASNGDLLVDQAKLGGGLLLRSKWGVQAELDSGELVEVKLNDKLIDETAIYLVFAANRFMPTRLRTFIDFI